MRRVPLGEAATFVNGYAFKPEQWSTSGIKIIRIQNLTGSTQEINYFDGVLNSKYRVTKGDLLISWSGTLGIFEWSKEDGWLNQHIFKVVFNKERIDKRYFKHVIGLVIDSMNRQVHGSTMKHITKKKFDKVEIPLPPLPIQKQIADLLDAADALRRKTQEQLALLDELARSVFLEMFGDPVTNEKGWKVKSLGGLTSMVGSGSTPRGGQKVYKHSGFTFIRSQNIRNNKVDFSDIYFIDSKTHDAMTRTWVKFGDVLLNITGASIGRTAVYLEESDQANVNQHVCIIRTEKEVLHPLYLLHHLVCPSYNRKILGANAGGTREAFNFKQIKQFSIMLPPIDLQMKFGAVLENLDTQRRTMTDAQANAERFFGCLQQQLFS